MDDWQVSPGEVVVVLTELSKRLDTAVARFEAIPAQIADHEIRLRIVESHQVPTKVRDDLEMRIRSLEMDRVPTPEHKQLRSEIAELREQAAVTVALTTNRKWLIGIVVLVVLAFLSPWLASRTSHPATPRGASPTTSVIERAAVSPPRLP